MENVSFLDKFKMPFSQLWEKHKLFLFIFGLLIVLVKFREVIIDILISSARAKFEDAKQKDANLAGQQNAANNKANQLIDNANKMDQNKPEVKEDWHKS